MPQDTKEPQRRAGLDTPTGSLETRTVPPPEVEAEPPAEGLDSDSTLHIPRLTSHTTGNPAARAWSWIKRGTTSTDWFIVLLTAVIAGTSYFQWREIHSGSTDTHTLAVAADAQAKKMGAMSDAADKIGHAAENMVLQEQRIADSAYSEAQVSQRAWVAAAIQSKPHENGKAVAVGQTLDSQFLRTNTGRTPAVNVRSIGQRTVVERRNGAYQAPSFTYSAKEFTLDGTLMPGQTTYADIETMMTQTDFDKISSGSVRIYAHGRVEYDDIFGVHHWANFCAFLLPSGAWANCPYHNDVDQNPN